MRANPPEGGGGAKLQLNGWHHSKLTYRLLLRDVYMISLDFPNQIYTCNTYCCFGSVSIDFAEWTVVQGSSCRR